MALSGRAAPGVRGLVLLSAGLLLLLPASVGMWVPSHLTCDGGERWEGFPLPPAAQCGIWRRFSQFVDTVCRCCFDAGVDCGCDDGYDNPAVAELMRYVAQTIATVQTAAPAGPVPRVVVRVSGDLGTQLLSTVNALILAVFSQRALMVLPSGQQHYEPEPVFDIRSAIAGVPCRTRVTISLAHTRGYEDLVMENYISDETAEIECIFLEEISEDPYLWFANTDVAQFLTDSFRGRHFFFLSHFVYLGDWNGLRVHGSGEGAEGGQQRGSRVGGGGRRVRLAGNHPAVSVAGAQACSAQDQGGILDEMICFYGVWKALAGGWKLDKHPPVSIKLGSPNMLRQAAVLEFRLSLHGLVPGFQYHFRYGCADFLAGTAVQQHFFSVYETDASGEVSYDPVMHFPISNQQKMVRLWVELWGVHPEVSTEEALVASLDQTVGLQVDEPHAEKASSDNIDATVASDSEDVLESAFDEKHVEWVWEDKEWHVDRITSYREARASNLETVKTLELLNRRGWDVIPEPTHNTSLGIPALVLNHWPDDRRASTEKMLRAVGFDHVEFPATIAIDELDLSELEKLGWVSSEWEHSGQLLDHDKKMRYIAHALDYKAAVAMTQAPTAPIVPWVAIVEDDLVLTTSPKTAAQRIREAVDQAPEDADAIFLEWCHDDCGKALYHKEKSQISWTFEPHCTAAILYSDKGLGKLLQALSKIEAAIDYMISKLCAVRYLYCFKLRFPAFAQDLKWGSSVDKRKVRVQHHDIAPAAFQLCKDYYVASEYSMWFKSLHNGYQGIQMRHRENGGEVGLVYSWCRWHVVEMSHGIFNVNNTVKISVQGLVVGVEYRVLGHVRPSGGRGQEALKISGGSGSRLGLPVVNRTIAVSPGQSHVVLEIDIPLALDSTAAGASGPGDNMVSSSSASGAPASIILSVKVLDEFSGLSPEEHLLAVREASMCSR